MVLGISLEVDAWDCYLYNGVLYVITLDNRIRGYDWGRLVEHISNAETKNGLHYAFCRANVGDEREMQKLRSGGADLFRRSILRAVNQPIQVDAATLSLFELFDVENPLGTITSAFTVYASELFLSSSKGLFSLKLPRTSTILSLDPKSKIWDGRAVSLSGSRASALAISAGSEGLFRYRLHPSEAGAESAIEHLSKHHTTYTSWLDVSMLRTSAKSPGEILAFERLDYDSKNLSGQRERFVARVVLEDDFAFTWSAGKHVFGLGRNGRVSVFELDAKQLAKRHTEEEPLSAGDLKSMRGAHLVPYDGSPISVAAFDNVKYQNVQLQFWKGSVLSAGASGFGAVIECENAVVVVDRDAKFWTIPLRVARWRVYARATSYFNQLHLVTDDRIVALAHTDPILDRLGLPRPRPFWRSDR